jgi:hypothetical protein
MFDSALVLTPWYQPHSIAAWHESVTAVLTKKANVLEEYDSVTSCKKCNGRKGNRTPQEAGMRLLSHPVRPKSLPLSATVFVLPKNVPELWLPYLEGYRTMRMVG